MKLVFKGSVNPGFLKCSFVCLEMKKQCMEMRDTLYFFFSESLGVENLVLHLPLNMEKEQ